MDTIEEILQDEAEEEEEDDCNSDEELDSDDESASSDDDDTVPTSSTKGRERDPNKEVLAIAREETIRLRTWRVIVIFLILLTGAIITAKTHLYLEREENDDHETNVSKEGAHL
jgi:hypothetical protein